MNSTGVTDIAHDPTDLPPPITRTGPEKVRVDLETVELEARLDSNSTYTFWTFNGRYRVRSFASESATTSRCISRTTKTAR